MLVTDSAGRELEIRPLTFLEQMDLALAVASNDDGAEWWKETKQICSVRKIDGKAVHFPDAYLQVEALAMRLDDAGLQAVEIADLTWEWKPADPPIQLEVSIVTRVERFRLKRIGRRAADVHVWQNIAALAFWVRSINGEACQAPTDMKSLRAAVARLDDPGMMTALVDAQRDAAALRALEMAEDDSDDLETDAKN